MSSKSFWDVVLVLFILIGVFFAGVVWAPAFGMFEGVKTYLESTSYIATFIACAVAVSSLTAWKKTFVMQSKYDGVRGIKVAYQNLKVIRGLMVDYANYHAAQVCLLEGEDDKQKRYENSYLLWIENLAIYSVAWASGSHCLDDSMLVTDYDPKLLKRIFFEYKCEFEHVFLVGEFGGENYNDYVEGKCQRVDDFLMRGDVLLSSALMRALK
ncbi:hypothetical protein [Pseudomonas sp. RL_5y_Pfl2_69]|uniref:hypothetical protein n=1 Tax=Pseudomonas sp. RL_5y_Pfl2_69 TaxID=3088711 RepID=UPI0030DA668A